ncbi:MAG: adenylosuccinate lyase [Candidatus Bathyarchaeota archaeon]|jgi:adenylosuccinate lyase|nr:MAG: adenylosuccinate lyase [Candidatus Bathyarchaeota archaeon]
MTILPIDTGRYGTREMKLVFDEKNKLQRMLDVEAALAWAHAEVGEIPRKDADYIASKASTRYVKLKRVKEIEQEIRHETASVVRALSEQCSSSSAYVHLGATSYDIIDTANALLLKEAITLICEKQVALQKVLIKKADRYKKTIIIGRTHGQHALPTTLGFKFAVWMRENARNIERLEQCAERLLVGKMTGAVGTQAGLGQHGTRIQELVMKRLGIGYADISTQILQRDRHAELVCLLAIIASSLDNIASEIRELQRPEIAEAFEAFEYKKQVGSSSMSQKRNPEISERICGLAKILRGLVVPSLENVTTWHERDLTQSSSERFTIPEACVLIDYILFLAINVLKSLRVDEKQMQRNLMITQGRTMAEAIMTILVKKGMNRQVALELLRQLTVESELKGRNFEKVLAKDGRVRDFLNEREIREALNPQNYLGTAVEQVKLMIEKTKEEIAGRP